MKKLMLLSVGLFFILASCEQRDTREGYDDDVATTEDGAAMGGLFTTTYEDLIEGKNDLEEDLMELKRDRVTRAGERTTEYDSLVNSIEQQIQMMDAKANEFRGANTDDQKQRLKDEYDLLEDEASNKIDHINNTFETNESGSALN